MTTDPVWAQKVVEQIGATAEPIEQLGEDIKHPAQQWTPWPTAQGPFMLRAQWRRVNGRVRMTGLEVQMVESSASFTPLTTTALRALRLPEIDRQLLAEARGFAEDALDKSMTDLPSDTEALLESARAALADEPQPKRGPRRDRDIELLTLIAKVYDAAEGRHPVRAVLHALIADQSPYRDQFAYTDVASMNRALAKIGRRVDRARSLGLIKTEKLTIGRQRTTKDSPRPEHGKRPAKKASRATPPKEDR